MTDVLFFLFFTCILMRREKKRINLFIHKYHVFIGYPFLSIPQCIFFSLYIRNHRYQVTLYFYDGCAFFLFFTCILMRKKTNELICLFTNITSVLGIDFYHYLNAYFSLCIFAIIVIK